jgi:hypothetical protein
MRVSSVLSLPLVSVPRIKPYFFVIDGEAKISWSVCPRHVFKLGFYLRVCPEHTQVEHFLTPLFGHALDLTRKILPSLKPLQGQTL